MFCPKCGNQAANNAKFCPKCGHSLTTGGAIVQVTAPYPSSQSGPELAQSPVFTTLYQQKLAQAASVGLGMDWFKFIIYVQCFLGGFSGLVSGVMLIMGLRYGDNASLMYEYHFGLKIVDIVYGLSSIVVGVLLIYTRVGLKKFRAGSVGIYLFLPLISAMSAILYSLAVSIILHTSPFNLNLVLGGTIGLVVGSIVLFIINYVYFNRRRSLFNEV